MTASPSSSPLLEGFDHQDKIFSSAFSILQQAIALRAFPAASVAITHNARLVALKALGDFTYENEITKSKTDCPFTEKEMGAPFLASSARSGQGAVTASTISPSTLFDLASLTKVVATTPMAMILYQRGLLDLDAPVAAVVPEFTADSATDPRRHQVTLRQLLTHSSGLPAYEKLFLKARSHDEFLHAAFTIPLTADPGIRAEYSDIGFIILGVALERLGDEPLDHFCRREIFAPLAMTNTIFNPPGELRPRIPPTADEREQEDECGAGAPARELLPQGKVPSASQQIRSTFRQKIIQGEVQDENAYVLGGVAAHAGLFSTAQDLAKFAHSLLTAGSIFRPETVSLFTRRESKPEGTSRALGWDTPSGSSQSGKYFFPQSFGHLGYTGTSLWIDPARQISIALLTNRTWPDCSNQSIKKVRPEFHDAVIEALRFHS